MRFLLHGKVLDASNLPGRTIPCNGPRQGWAPGLQLILETGSRSPTVPPSPVTGPSSCLLKVRCRDTPHLENLPTHQIKAQPGVERTQTTIVLSTQKEDGPLPVWRGGGSP